METIPDKSEMLRRFALLLKHLSWRQYPLSISADIETDNPSRLDAHDGKTYAQCGFVISDRDYWEGDLLVSVRLPDLHLREDFVFALKPFFLERGDLVDLMGDVLVWSHLDAFEKFSTLVAPSSWEHGCMKWRHRRYGLTLVSEDDNGPALLDFRFHVSAVFWALGARLQKAAEEGQQ